MKRVKHGISLLVVLVAVVAAAFGGRLQSSRRTPRITQESTYQVTKDGDYLIGATGLHW